jgi:hypothetical protein
MKGTTMHNKALPHDWMQMPEGDILDASGMRVTLDQPAIVRKVIIAWHRERAQCAYWLAAFSDPDRRRLAEAVVAYRTQFYAASDLTVERLLAEWDRAIADLLPPRPAAAARAA